MFQRKIRLLSLELCFICFYSRLFPSAELIFQKPKHPLPTGQPSAQVPSGVRYSQSLHSSAIPLRGTGTEGSTLIKSRSKKNGRLMLAARHGDQSRPNAFHRIQRTSNAITTNLPCAIAIVSVWASLLEITKGSSQQGTQVM